MFETQGGHAESNPRPSEEGVSFYHVLRPLDHVVLVPILRTIMWLKIQEKYSSTLSKHMVQLCKVIINPVDNGMSV